MNKFQLHIPNAQISGCFFHFSQNIYRRIQREGLQVEYQQNANFALQARMVPALAFVPIADLDACFNDLCGHVDPSLQPILDYFEDTYLGRFQRRGNQRRPVLFPPTTWNVLAIRPSFGRTVLLFSPCPSFVLLLLLSFFCPSF